LDKARANSKYIKFRHFRQMIHDVNQTILESSQDFSINHMRQSILLNIGSNVAILQKNWKEKARTNSDVFDSITAFQSS
jgi:hypothetical protein